jgi:hypothetical protein
MATKSPQDSTLRNTQASMKRDKALEEELRDVKRRLKHIEKVIYEQIGIDLREQKGSTASGRRGRMD